MTRKEKINFILNCLDEISDKRAIKVAYDLKTIAIALYYRIALKVKWQQIPLSIYASYTVFQYWLGKLKRHGYLAQIEGVVKK